jgi:hypothetical protein
MNYESFTQESRVKTGPPHLGAVMHRYDKTDGAVDYQHICISDTLMKHSTEGTGVSAKKQRKTRMRGRMVKKIGEFKDFCWSGHQRINFIFIL